MWVPWARTARRAILCASATASETQGVRRSITDRTEKIHGSISDTHRLAIPISKTLSR
jgi:hypothetical protein